MLVGSAVNVSYFRDIRGKWKVDKDKHDGMWIGIGGVSN